MIEHAVFLGFCLGFAMLLVACAYTMVLGPDTPSWVFWDIAIGAPLTAACYALIVRRQ